MKKIQRKCQNWIFNKYFNGPFVEFSLMKSRGNEMYAKMLVMLCWTQGLSKRQIWSSYGKLWRVKEINKMMKHTKPRGQFLLGRPCRKATGHDRKQIAQHKTIGARPTKSQTKGHFSHLLPPPQKNQILLPVLFPCAQNETFVATRVDLAADDSMRQARADRAGICAIFGEKVTTDRGAFR